MINFWFFIFTVPHLTRGLEKHEIVSFYLGKHRAHSKRVADMSTVSWHMRWRRDFKGKESVPGPVLAGQHLQQDRERGQCILNSPYSTLESCARVAFLPRLCSFPAHHRQKPPHPARTQHWNIFITGLLTFQITPAPFQSSL